MRRSKIEALKDGEPGEGIEAVGSDFEGVGEQIQCELTGSAAVD